MRDALSDTNPLRLEWLKAINKEMKEQIDREVIIPLTVEETQEINKLKPFKSKLVYRVTRELDDMLKFKARMVACGYSQIFGTHYNINNSPTVMFRTFLIILHIAAIFKWARCHLDVGNAYLEALLNRALYIYLPLDWTKGKKIAVRLNRNLYGLKQAGLLWYLLYQKTLLDFGFSMSNWDPCTFFMFKDGMKVILTVFVDDNAIVSNNAKLIEEIKSYLSARFKKITDLGKLKRFLGINVTEDDSRCCLYLSQKEMINEYVRTLLTAEAAKASIPISPVVKMDKTAGEEPIPPIWKKTGSIQYISDKSRPDIKYAASVLGQYAHKSYSIHDKVADQVLNYLSSTQDLSLKLGGQDKHIKLFGYCDASFIRDGDSKPQLGQCWFLSYDSGAILSKSQKGKTVALSSTEAELDALVEALKECIWLRGFLNEIGYTQREPTLIFQDNKSTITLSNLVSILPRTKHLANRLNFVRQEVQVHCTCRLNYLPSDRMVADLLTKPLPRQPFEAFRKVLLEGHNCVDPESNAGKAKTMLVKDEIK